MRPICFILLISVVWVSLTIRTQPRLRLVELNVFFCFHFASASFVYDLKCRFPSPIVYLTNIV